MSKTAIFAGSFDPFTKGHQNIVDRALQSVASKVIIAIGVNHEKKYMFPLEERLQAIQELYKDNPRVRVESYEGLTTDFAKEQHADFLLRGVRSIKDFEYERDIADINKRLTGIETILLFTDYQYSSISSSIVRELYAYKKNIEDFLP
ncbi:MAG: pantetheine-phosphate adenylyltransferase [Bacteroidaceae bacterium]|nr:pantetheine-phosphate adenylyltransferase [Bacteroidaceae bacterium]